MSSFLPGESQLHTCEPSIPLGMKLPDPLSTGQTEKQENLQCRRGGEESEEQPHLSRPISLGMSSGWPLPALALSFVIRGQATYLCHHDHLQIVKGKLKGQEAIQDLGWASRVAHALRRGHPAGFVPALFYHTPASGKRLLQGDDGHGKVEAQAVLALPHLLLALELTHHIIYVLLLSQKDKAKGRRCWHSLNICF